MKNRKLVVAMFAVGFGLPCAAMMAEPPAAVNPPPAQEAKPAPAAQPAKPAKAEKTKLYDEAADGKAQIAAALAKAKKENRRVLIQWGGNWCGWCIRLHELTKSDPTLSKELMYEYDVVHVDTGQPAGKNIDLAEKYGADVKKHGFPFLTILDADGKPIANQETESLEVKNAQGESAGIKEGHDPKKVLAFLKANEAKPLNAEAVVGDGLARARETGKVVFLHFGAPWCVWCHRMEGWMAKPEIAAILDKNFVDVKIDIDRMTGGKGEMAKYCKTKNEGIPWFVFLSAEGATVATSDGPKGNVGFPAEAGEIAHFAEMLTKACPKMSEGDRKVLLDSLKPKEKTVGAAPAAGR
ncbi:MAG: thioredoxin family protein [Phycisphaerales bacterium]